MGDPQSLPHLILASGSPRRRDLLAALRGTFRVLPSAVEEPPFSPGDDPGAFAERLALHKALFIQQTVGQASPPATLIQPVTAVPRLVVVGADTLVYLDRESLAKPRDEAEAAEMLRRLRNREHLVITGLAVVNEDRQTCHVTTRVRMRDYSDDEIDSYTASGDPMDKAGAYAIQNPAFHPVAGIDGCYQNVVGLPLCALIRMLRHAGVRLPPIQEGDLSRECWACAERSVLTGEG